MFRTPQYRSRNYGNFLRLVRFAHEFFFGLISLARFVVNIGFLDRPLSFALLWGLITGQWELAAGIGVFCELFWLDLFPAGTYIPPHGQLAVVYSLTTAHCLGLYRPWDLLPVLGIALLAARFGARIENWHRGMQNTHYNQLLQSVRQESGLFAPERFVLRSAIQLVLLNGFFFFLITQGSVLGIAQLRAWWPVAPFELQWAHVWGVALLGAVAALRTKTAYSLWGVGLALMAIGAIFLPAVIFPGRPF